MRLRATECQTSPLTLATSLDPPPAPVPLKEFVAYSEDSGGITYVPPPNYVPPPPSMRDTEFAAEAGMLHPKKERTVRGSSAEMEHWVPSDAYALANDFRRQHMAQMPMEIFAELLLRLNRVWRAREAKRLERQQVR